MFSEDAQKLFQRDLAILSKEIAAYKNENSIWEISGEIKNAAGNLSLHLCGNLRHFIGAVLGNTSYIRNRDLEFSSPGISREALLSLIETTSQEVSTTLSHLSKEAWNKLYTVPFHQEPVSLPYFLFHLFGHLNYHLGQINYHRRMLDKNH